MASFASYATMGGARKQAWTNYKDASTRGPFRKRSNPSSEVCLFDGGVWGGIANTNM